MGTATKAEGAPRMGPTRRLAATAALLTATALGGCGGVETHTYSSSGPVVTAPPPGKPATVTSSTAVPEAATTDAPAAGVVTPSSTTAAPPGRPVDARSGEATVTAAEFAFGASSIRARPGRLRLTLKNDGRVAHELIVLRTAAPVGSLLGRGGRISEAASVGEVAEAEPGSERSAVLTLAPGRYVYVCNLPGHYASGMRGTLLVR